jgi:hypothetical protein
MNAEDTFSQHYEELLDDTYDVVDRIVLNAYFPLACSSGGFRTWWRQFHDGDEDLDDTHLMRMAGRFSRRTRGWAEKNGIPVVYCKVGERKHLIAQKYLPEDPDFRGIFLVLVGRAQGPVWEVECSDTGKIRSIHHKNPMPWVNHYHFHIIDEQWGHVTIRVNSHPPFPAQIMLNGHEFVGCRARNAGIDFTKEGNCFTNISGAAGLSDVADALRSQAAVGWLRQVCERWIYQCICFGLSFDEQRRSGFHYSYSVYQLEYSRNLLFTHGRKLDQVFNGVIDRTRGQLDVKTVKTIFGSKRRPYCKSKDRVPRFEVVLEKPTYDLTIFKLHFNRLTLKMYSKGERVLRIEAVAHNVRDLRCGRVVDRFPKMVTRLGYMVERFLNVIRCIDVAWISDGTLESLPIPSVVGQTRVGGVDVSKSRMRSAMAAVTALASTPRGFTAKEHAEKVRSMDQDLAESYTPRHAAYDLKKLRGKALVRKLGENSRRYEPTPEGLKSMTALVVLRDKVIVPLLANKGRLKMGPKPRDYGPLDTHYDAIQRAMQGLFKAVGIAA